MPGIQKLNSEKKREDERFLLSYPQDKIERLPIILHYGFRPFFLMAPAYLITSVLLWGAFWTGLLPLSFLNNPLEWHLYEMLFGVTSAMMIGFILTAVPELYEQEAPIVGKTLFYLAALWLLGRLSFWLIDWLGVAWVAITNIPLLIWVVFLVAKPIINDPLRRQLSLAILFLIISGLQILFFASKLNWLSLDGMTLLKSSLGAFMILVLLAARRINTEAINRWLEQQQIDDVYLARPPRYNLAVLTVATYSIMAFLFPQNSALTWLAFAAMAAILNTLNDFFIDEDPVFIRPFIWPLFMLLIMMALGYGFIAWDHLNPDIYQLNHLRHLLTMGALGMAYYMVLVIVSHLHTGRRFISNQWIGIGAFLIILGSLTRAFGPMLFPEQQASLIGLSALIWVMPFLMYLKLYSKWLLSPRADGLPG